jgi:hypothetical protein
MALYFFSIILIFFFKKSNKSFFEKRVRLPTLMKGIRLDFKNRGTLGKDVQISHFTRISEYKISQSGLSEFILFSNMSNSDIKKTFFIYMECLYAGQPIAFHLPRHSLPLYALG